MNRKYKHNYHDPWFNTVIHDPDIEDRGERISPDQMKIDLEWYEGLYDRKEIIPEAGK